jgi:hypothetical protein
MVWGRNGDLCGVTRLAWEVVPLRREGKKRAPLES